MAIGLIVETQTDIVDVTFQLLTRLKPIYSDFDAKS